MAGNLRIVDAPFGQQHDRQLDDCEQDHCPAHTVQRQRVPGADLRDPGDRFGEIGVGGAEEDHQTERKGDQGDGHRELLAGLSAHHEGQQGTDQRQDAKDREHGDVIHLVLLPSGQPAEDQHDADQDGANHHPEAVTALVAVLQPTEGAPDTGRQCRGAVDTTVDQ